jgi:eukaryotic-like serine/threonine-protein kinase
LSEALAHASSAAGGPGPAPAVIGRFGRYILVDRLGAGGMAEVFRALVLGPEQFQRVVVVKRILPKYSASPAFIQMFIDEARLCGRLSHPNIIQVYEFGNQDQQHFITMEHVEGRSLVHILQRLCERDDRMSPTVAAEIARQVCRGLAYAHALVAEDGKPLGIIHRDLSPGNLIVGYSGSVKVLDFGIARVENRFRVGTTDPGCVKGKFSYLAPEQVTAKPIDHRADLFTMGIVLYEMLTRERLFRGETSVDSVNLLRTMRIPPPSERNPLVPARLDAIAMRALRRNPAERYQDATEMADALEGFLLENRVSSQELPGFMRNLYRNEIESDRLSFSRAQIEELIRQSPAPEDTPLEAAAGPRTGSVPPEAPSLPSDAAVPVSDEPTSHRSSDPDLDLDLDEVPARPRRLPLVIGGALLAAIALAVVFWPAPRPAPSRLGNPAAPAAGATPTVAAPAPTRPAPPAATPAPTPPAPAAPTPSAPAATTPAPTPASAGSEAEADSTPSPAAPGKPERRRPREQQKVRHALPIDPFAN